MIFFECRRYFLRFLKALYSFVDGLLKIASLHTLHKWCETSVVPLACTFASPWLKIHSNTQHNLFIGRNLSTTAVKLVSSVSKCLQAMTYRIRMGTHSIIALNVRRANVMIHSVLHAKNKVALCGRIDVYLHIELSWLKNVDVKCNKKPTTMNSEWKQMMIIMMSAVMLMETMPDRHLRSEWGQTNVLNQQQKQNRQQQ